MPVNVVEIKKRLAMLLKDENLVNEYIRRFGPAIDMKNIKSIKDEHQASAQEGSAEQEEKGLDPIYEINLTCPVCNNNKITGYELKAKSQSVTENYLLQATYKGAMGHKTLDYDRLAVTVCPRCLFASADKRDFVTLNKITGKDMPSQIPPNAVITLQEKIGERKAAVQGVANMEAYFKRPRNLDSAILSYRMAALRAKVEAFHELPNALYKVASCYMKIAKFLKQKKEEDAPALKEALDYFIECFKNSNASSEGLEYRVIYLIIAINLKMGDQKKAHAYIGAYDRIKTDLKNKAHTDPSVNLTFIDKWIDKARFLWEERERADLFD